MRRNPQTRPIAKRNPIGKPGVSMKPIGRAPGSSLAMRVNPGATAIAGPGGHAPGSSLTARPGLMNPQTPPSSQVNFTGGKMRPVQQNAAAVGAVKPFKMGPGS